MLHFVYEVGVEVGKRAHALVGARTFGDRDQPVVSGGLAVALCLLRLDDGDEATAHQTTGEGGLIH